ncbi:hypothetical protein [Blastococcus sp. TF02A-26]|uniref:hypothetical protein n=1 Tax=Blastococcus sp. TF02A-26 TaxID=2250577 RepID=UPI000DEB7E56|nr:hypothetical protein [Blastococcus sp. TF02A-26]RBY89829.1 hypothetical protein DQ240_02635 [Blastococcus sp. TF02A-26]
MLRMTRERLAWLAVTVLLALEIRFDVLRLLDPGYKDLFQADSDALVRAEMLDPAPVLLPPLGSRGAEYTSQFGLQGMVMNWLSPGDHLYEAMRMTTALLAAAVLATAVMASRRAWGNRVAAVLLVLLTLSFWTNGFGASTYWQLWTMLLPILVPLLVWPRLGEGRRKWVRGCALVAGLVLLKCLCGYEFISTVLLGSAAAVAFHEFRGRIDRRLLLRLGVVLVAGVAGFALAMALHVGQLLALYGDASVIGERMGERTFSPSSMALALDLARAQDDPLFGWLLGSGDVVGLWLYQMTAYLRAPAVTLPAPTATGFGPGVYGIPIWAFVAVYAALAVEAYRGRRPDAALQRRLAVAGGLGLAGALSWLVLAYGHMINHVHIDAIVFYLPFLPVVFLMIALRTAEVSRRVWAGRGSRAQPPPAAPRPDDPPTARLVPDDLVRFPEVPAVRRNDPSGLPL